MTLHHDCLILVADGQKYLFLLNEGDVRTPALAVVAHGEQPVAAAHDLGSDGPGRAFSGAGGTSSAVAMTDLHQQAEDRFAEAVAALLNARVAAGAGEVMVVAPPRTLAQLRQHYSDLTRARLVAEVDKDLTKHPVAEITAILSR